MKLVIKEYLTLLKESDELDALLPDLLLSMGLEPFIYPQKGTRQYGVDLAARGIYDEDDTLLLFTIKQGNINRSEWDRTSQGVKDSLDEILDVFLQLHIRDEHKHLKKKIVLCTGGILESSVDTNWTGYTNRNQIEGEREYEFWGGDKLSILIEKHMLNENLFSPDIRSKFRRTLVKLDDSDYDFRDYYELLNQLLLAIEFKDFETQSTRKKVRKIFRSIDLSLNIVFYWAKQGNNLKPALYCAERTLLTSWEFTRKNELIDKEWFLDSLIRIKVTFEKIYYFYFEKIKGNCLVLNGFSRHHSNFPLVSLNIFEQLGILTNFGLCLLFTPTDSNQIRETELRAEYIEYTYMSLKSMINKNKALLNPVYDNHIIEISSTIYFLAELKEFEFIRGWISDLTGHIWFAYKYYGKYFPIDSDSFDDLVSLNISSTVRKEDMFTMSSLIPILSQWCIMLNFQEEYEEIRGRANDTFKDSIFQIFYPDEKTDQVLYTENAGRKSGLAEAPIELVPFEEMKRRIMMVKEKAITFKDVSANVLMPIIPFVAFRHFRTPMFPMYWQNLKSTTSNTEN
ncbi:MAG: hypothetical protein K8S56_05100 [Candidatus Cloacimonetes bacterium]|nr:hypothetical protein [Candidatus Cloacimonadota bacterium]